MVVLSYKNGKGTMIWIVLDAASGDYELVEFDVDGKRGCANEPAVGEGYDWSALRERALPLSLMGLLAEETLIAQRLAKLGRRKLAAEPQP